MAMAPSRWGGELGRQEDGRRAVRAADDGDGCRLLGGEQAGGDGADEGNEDPELGGRAEQEGLRIGDERPEVGHGPDAHEDQGREYP